MSRCKACDNPLSESEIIWREDIKQHEELCRKCRAEVYDLSIDDIETIDKFNADGEHDGG